MAHCLAWRREGGCEMGPLEESMLMLRLLVEVLARVDLNMDGSL